jgi:hypothetical protein
MYRQVCHCQWLLALGTKGISVQLWNKNKQLLKDAWVQTNMFLMSLLLLVVTYWLALMAWQSAVEEEE